MSWSSTRPRRATSGRCPTTRSTTFRSPTCATEFLRDENHPQKVQLGSSRLHSLVGAGRDTREGGAGLRRRTRRGHGPLRMGSRCAGSRRTSRSTDTRAIRTRVSTRCDRTATSGWNSTASCSPTPPPRCCSSKPACRQGITSIRPTLHSSISNPARRRRCAPTKGRRRATGQCGPATRCIRTWPGRTTTRCLRSPPIAGLVAFYNEKFDIIVDGAALARPKTQFS